MHSLVDRSRVQNLPFGFAIALGLANGSSRFGGFGRRLAVAVVANGSDVWDGTATTIPSPIDAGEQLEIVSDNVADAAAGTGVQSVRVHYLDPTGALQVEILTMNGTTPVVFAASNVRFVQLVAATAVGSNGAAVGNITIYKQGAATVIYKRISPGGNNNIDTFRMVPLGKTFYLAEMYATGTDQSIETRLRITGSHHGTLTDVFYEYGSLFLEASTMSRGLLIPVPIPALAKVKMSIFVPAGKAGANVSAGYMGWIE